MEHDSGSRWAEPFPLHSGTEDERLLESEGLEQPGRESWRIFRIMGEFVEGFEEMAKVGRGVTIFGSARTQPDHPEYLKCVETARLLGEAGYGIITGGGPGIMEAANKGAREAGVCSVGCNIELPFEQSGNEYIDVSIDFRYFFVRKTMFVKYAQAFVIFPGGFGTMDELFESLTLIQTGKVRHFPLVLMGKDYWGGLMDWLRKTMAHEGKISEEDMDLILFTDDPEECRDHIVHRLEQRKAILEGKLPSDWKPPR